jgi:hypothetical protein
MPGMPPIGGMRKWLTKQRIFYEVETIEFNRSLKIKFIDKKNNCVLAERAYSMRLLREISESRVVALTKLIKDFQTEEIDYLLFGDTGESLDGRPPTYRLIRRD